MRVIRLPASRGRSARRVAGAVGVLIAYLVLSGDAIRCQYFPPDHHHHSGSSTGDPSHATHCVLANHGYAAIPSIASLGTEPIELVGALPIVAPLIAGMLLLASASARAPPPVRRHSSI